MIKKLVNKLREIYGWNKKIVINEKRELELIKEIQQLRKEKSDLYEQIQRFENEGGYTKKID